MGALAAGYAVEVYGTQEYKYSIKQFEKRYFENYSSVLNL